MIRSALALFVCIAVILGSALALGQSHASSRLEELEEELEVVKQAGNVAEIREVQALIESLGADWEQQSPAESSVELTFRDTDVIVEGGGLALRFGRNGHINQIDGAGSLRFSCEGSTVYRIANELAVVSAVKKVPRGVRISLKAGEASAQVLIEGGHDITVRFEDTKARYVTFGFGLPLHTKFHQAASHNLVDLIDHERLTRGPVDSFSEGGFQILVAEVDREFLSVSGRSDYRHRLNGSRRAYASRCLARSKDVAFEYTWRPEFSLVLSRHDKLEDVAEEYRHWMEKFFELKPIHNSSVQWLDDVKLIVTFDMGRSNGDAAHNYQHLIDLSKELYAAGAKGGILFYLPGWCGMYDAAYPDYTPKDWLGGEDKFREMVEVLHACGYRVQYDPHVSDCRHGHDER